jgi:hypothetical protein
VTSADRGSLARWIAMPEPAVEPLGGASFRCTDQRERLRSRCRQRSILRVTFVKEYGTIVVRTFDVAASQRFTIDTSGISEPRQVFVNHSLAGRDWNIRPAYHGYPHQAVSDRPHMPPS